MVVFTGIDYERILIGLVCYSVLDVRPKHHLVAVHEVEHDIAQSWLESLLVYTVEVNQLVSGNLDSVVALHVEYEASQGYCIVKCPVPVPSFLFYNYFEEKNTRGRPGNQGFVIHQVHLSEIHVGHPCEFVIFDVGIVHSEHMALSVEQIGLIVFFVGEGSVWEVFLGAIHFHLDDIAVNLLSRVIVNEMIVNFRLVVEQGNKYLGVSNEAADDEWVRESRDGHREVINAQSFVEVKLVSCNFFLCSRFVRKCSDPELAIIHVNSSVFRAILILLYFFELDVVLRLTPNFLFKCNFVV